MEVMDIAKAGIDIVYKFLGWMFATTLIPGFSIGTVLFGLAIIGLSVDFLAALMQKKQEKES